MVSKKNFLNYSVHLINGILPIVLIVYLNGKSSLTFMGYFFKALAIIGTVQLFVDYGFNFSGIRSYRDLSIAESPFQARVGFFSNLIIAKMIIGAFIILAYIFYSFFFLPGFIVADFSYVVFGVLFSIANFNWFFYAIDKSLEFSLLLLLLRVLSFFILFFVPLFLDNLLLINFAPFVIANIALLVYLVYKKIPRQRIVRPRIDIVPVFKSGWKIFANGIVISFLTMSWPILFSRLISIEMVGVFGLADRISKGLRNLIGPLPFFVLSRHGHYTADFKFSNLNAKYIRIFAFLLIAVPLLFMLIPNPILGIFFKGDVLYYRELLNIYAIGFVAAALNSLFYTYLITASKESIYLIYFILSYCMGIVLGLVLGTYIFMPLFVESFLCIMLAVKFIVEYRKVTLLDMNNKTQ